MQSISVSKVYCFPVWLKVLLILHLSSLALRIQSVLSGDAQQVVSSCIPSIKAKVILPRAIKHRGNSFFSVGVDSLANSLSFLDPIEDLPFITFPLSKTKKEFYCSQRYHQQFSGTLEQHCSTRKASLLIHQLHPPFHLHCTISSNHDPQLIYFSNNSTIDLLRPFLSS